MRYRDIRNAGLLDLPYDPETFDCRDFAILVQSRLFNRSVLLPPNDLRGLHAQASLSRLSDELGERTDAPVDGDIVLTREFGRASANHMGVYFLLDHRPYMLHCNDPASRCVKIADLAHFSLSVEGYYRWKLA